MCRFAAYLGPPTPIGTLVYDAPHGLEVQAYRPATQLHGAVNVDGTGVAWWPAPDQHPVRYATTGPPWSDGNLRAIAPHLRAPAIVAAVRGATPGIPHGRAAVAPFTFGPLAIAHNGWLGTFRGVVGPRLLQSLPARWLTAVEVMSDSLVLAVLLAARHDAGSDLLKATADTLEHVTAVCHAAGAQATLNLVVSDGRTIVASRTSVGERCNSLSTLMVDGPGDQPAVVVASEPLDDRDWQTVPTDHLVQAGPDGLRTLPLDLGAAA